MKKLFITGMGRSGTTLLDKLLTNHPELDVLSQPLPLIFVDAKRRFLATKGFQKYFVLNDDLVHREYTQEEFDTFLTNLEMNTDELISLFKKMDTYSGQSTKKDFPINVNSGFTRNFSESIDKCLKSYKTDTGCRYIGSKEIMCEEFLPYLCNDGYKCILIIRDPRDVLASANYPKGEKYIGDKKPTLFILRSWRKSVEYAYQLKDNKNFHLLRYEDLIEDPLGELNLIADFLSIPRYKRDHFRKGILDRNGEVWQANSSFGIQGSFVSKRPKEMYKKTLSDEEIAYTESVCGLELNWLAYSLQKQENTVKIIKNFKDHGVDNNQQLSTDFSSDTTCIDSEINRLEEFKDFYSEY